MVKHDVQLGADITSWVTRANAKFGASLGVSEEDYATHRNTHLTKLKL